MMPPLPPADSAPNIQAFAVARNAYASAVAAAGRGDTGAALACICAGDAAVAFAEKAAGREDLSREARAANAALLQSLAEREAAQ